MVSTQFPDFDPTTYCVPRDMPSDKSDALGRILFGSPLFSCRDTSHAVQLVQNGLEAGQHRAIQLHRERAFETWLVLSLCQETL